MPAGVLPFLMTFSIVSAYFSGFCSLYFSYQEAGKIQQIRKYGELLSEEYTQDGIAVTAYVPAELYGQLV